MPTTARIPAGADVGREPIPPRSAGAGRRYPMEVWSPEGAFLRMLRVRWTVGGRTPSVEWPMDDAPDWLPAEGTVVVALLVPYEADQRREPDVVWFRAAARQAESAADGSGGGLLRFELGPLLLGRPFPEAPKAASAAGRGAE